MNRIYCFIIVVLSITGYSCKNNSGVKPYKVAAREIGVEQILNPQDLACTQNYLIVKNDKETEVFTVYGLPDLTYKYTYGRSGKGPGEFQAAYILPCSGDSVFISDFIQYAVTKNDIGGNFNVTGSYDLPQGLPLFNDIHFLGGDRFCFQCRDANKVGIQVWNFDTGKKEQDISLAENGNSLNEDGMLASCGNRMAYAYCYQDKLLIKDIESGKTMIVGSEKKDVENEIFYYSNIKATPRHIYALFQGYSEEEISADAEDKFSQVYVFDWDGNLLKKIELDRIVNLFAVDDAENNIYAMSPFDPERILKYQL